MKILLVIPPNSQEVRYGKFSSIGTLYPPLGLAYIAAVLEKNNHKVRVIDSEAMNYSYSDIKKIVKMFNPDMVGMSVYFNTINRCYKVAELIKKINGNIKIVLGGAQVTLDSNIIKDDNTDFGIYGEGEISLSKLINALENKSSLEKVSGLIWKRGKKLIVNKPCTLVQNLDELPMPARHLFPIIKYHSSANLRGKRTLNIMTSRGCPYKCTYCAGSLIFGGTYRYYSTDRVIEELRYLKEKYNVDDVQFYDETFTANKDRVIDLCDKMIKNNLNIEWSCFTRVNLVDPELLKKMKEAGCYQIFYGLESGVQRLLNLIKKGITVEQSRKAMKWTHEAGIETWVSFMINLPTETKEETEQTIRFALEVDPNFVQFPITTPYPGTEMYEQAKKSGKFLTDNWDKYTSWDVVFVSNGRTPEEIRETVKRAYRRFYLRPSYMIRKMRSVFKLPLSKTIRLANAFLSSFV